MNTSRKGFTLVEVMIAIMILSTLSLFTAQSINSWVKMKAKIQGDIDRWTEVYNALQVMERDINLAFNYRDMTKEVEERIKKNQSTSGSNQNTNQDNSDNNNVNINNYSPYGSAGGEATSEASPTQFLGEADNLHFTALNNVRKVIDTKESDQSETGYFLKKCKSRRNPEETSDCLWRRTAIFIDDDVTEGGNSIPLLENIKAFKLEYLGKGKDDWVPEWKTTEGRDAVTSGRFPDAVRITLSTEKNKKQVTVTSIVGLRFPNNAEEKKQDAEQNQNQNTQTTQ
jgi:prepilin-type N-terminal cleavage/methylation domain-containing protein